MRDIKNFWRHVAQKVRCFFSKGREIELRRVLSRVNDNNKHDLIFCEGLKVFDHTTSKKSDEGFTVQISVESCEQAMERWAKEMKSLDDGVIPEVTKRLSFETWEDFFDIFSDKGKAMIEELRKN